MVSAIAFFLLLLQLPATAILLSRLLQGPTRRPPLEPRSSEPSKQLEQANSKPAGSQQGELEPVGQPGTVTVVVPTLNEVERLQPCLDGLAAQSSVVREILVVDSRSTDGTPELVQAACKTEPRLRLLSDPPLPQDWVGRPWALHNGFLNSSADSRWLLGVDADTFPHPQLVSSLVEEAEAEGYDLISLAPRFILKFPGEWWLQPALLLTLIYRFGPAGGSPEGQDDAGDRIMANGQCFLIRRSLLESLEGYSSAKSSFCDDVTLARNAAAAGAKVAFWDGSKLLRVRMYEGFAETWREWGRSLDLKDAAKTGQVWGDAALLLLTQALPLPLLLISLWSIQNGNSSLMLQILLGLNGGLLATRLGLLGAIASSYDFSQSQKLGPLPAHLLFWLSPLADSLAVWRIAQSSLQTPKQWRGRSYS